jgi:hypothetical protein
VRLDKRRYIAVPRPTDQVILPMAGDGTIFNGCRPFADRDRILDLAEPVPFQARVFGATNGALGPKMLQQLLFSTPRAWINRLR